MATMQEIVGFIGLGLMGHGMAKNIVEKGYPLVVMGHRNRKPIEDLVGRGATEASSAKEVGGAVYSGVSLYHWLARGRSGHTWRERS
jgi:6-phosphogluconate dehydrogenase (decarboxylating)